MINSCEGINGLKKMNINEPPSFMSPESMQPPPTSILDTSAENFYPSPYDERLKADEAVTDGESFKECPCRRVRRSTFNNDAAESGSTTTTASPSEEETTSADTSAEQEG
eukprot:g2878.t1